MFSIKDLLANNRRWAEAITLREPGFFNRLARLQTPRYLWIGCSDSRVPANEIVGMMPGELFVHRNVANIVVHSDLNCLAVLQYAVDVLRVEHVIVCGHYGCGGVEAAWKDERHGLIDNWLRHVQDVRTRHQHLFPRDLPDSRAVDRLCELNVVEQVASVCRSTVIADAWRRGQSVAVHGWIYRLADGLIRDLGISVNRENAFAEAYQQSVRLVAAGEVGK